MRLSHCAGGFIRRCATLRCMAWWTLRVPASSANLGPGFDAIGLALGVYLTCRFRRSERLEIRVEGRDAEQVPTTEENLIWQSALAVARDVGVEIHPSGCVCAPYPDRQRYGTERGPSVLRILLSSRV
jgi:hypothetical protein